MARYVARENVPSTPPIAKGDVVHVSAIPRGTLGSFQLLGVSETLVQDELKKVEAAPAPIDPATSKALDDMTRDELKAKATEMDLVFVNNASREKLLELIKANGPQD